MPGSKPSRERIDGNDVYEPGIDSPTTARITAPAQGHRNAGVELALKIF